MQNETASTAFLKYGSVFRKFNENLEIININVDKLKEMYYNSNKKLTDAIPIIALVMTKEELVSIQEEVRNVYIEKNVQQYIINLVRETRNHDKLRDENRTA